MLSIAIFALLLSPAVGETKEFSVVIDRAEAEYTVEVAGTADPENVEIVFENLGDSAVVNPRMTVNGRYDWYDLASIVKEVTAGLETDEEKAFALYSWVLYKRFQRSPRDRSALHPVRAMNGYGYGICGHTSSWLKSLWTAAGLKARVQELWGHTVSEVWFDGGWRMLDGNVKVYYLDRDNRSIASLATLEQDKWLIERTIHARDAWVRRPDAPRRTQEFVRYLTTAKDNYEDHGYDGEIARNYTMAMVLKPGETLTRWWNPVHGKFEGRDERVDAPAVYGNGRLVWEPDLRRLDMKDYIRAVDGNVKTRGPNGSGPAIQVAELQDRLYNRPSRFTIPIHSPYPIVGGRLWCTLIKEGSSSLDQAAIFFGQPGWSAGNLYTYRWETGPRRVELDLDPLIMKQGATYDLNLGFNLRGNAESKPPTQAGLDAFRLVADLQVSPHSLPALARGRNVVRYRDESPGPRKIRITHRWREVDDRRPPAAVAQAVSPAHGEEVAGLEPTLKWAAPAGTGAGDQAEDYQVLVSLRPDCRWALSPTLHQSVGSAATEWKVPASFLNPGTTYYWKVRARNRHGDIGEWSRVFSFRTSAAAGRGARE